jgi:hypothetical protein
MMAIPQAKPQMKPADQTKNSDKKPDSKLKQGNINDLALTQGMINKLNNAGVKAGMGG